MQGDMLSHLSAKLVTLINFSICYYLLHATYLDGI